jgi:hypothetical protein
MCYDDIYVKCNAAMSNSTLVLKGIEINFKEVYGKNTVYLSDLF